MSFKLDSNQSNHVTESVAQFSVLSSNTLWSMLLCLYTREIRKGGRWQSSEPLCVKVQLKRHPAGLVWFYTQKRSGVLLSEINYNQGGCFLFFTHLNDSGSYIFCKRVQSVNPFFLSVPVSQELKVIFVWRASASVWVHPHERSCMAYMKWRAHMGLCLNREFQGFSFKWAFSCHSRWQAERWRWLL